MFRSTRETVRRIELVGLKMAVLLRVVTLLKPQDEKSRPPEPSANAKRLINLIVPASKRPRFIAHFEEEFAEVVEQRGIRRARSWYWNEIFRAIIPQTRKRIEDAFRRTRPVSMSGSGDKHD